MLKSVNAGTMTKYYYIKKNLSEIKRLEKNGMFSYTDLNDFRIQNAFNKYKPSIPKMERYQFTADDLRISISSVIKSIKRINCHMR